MIMISVALISVIIYLACDVVNMRSRMSAFISLIPSIVFCIIQYEQLCNQKISIVLITYFIILLGIMFSKQKVSKSFGFSIMILPWTIIIFGAPQTLIDIVIFVVGALFVLLFVGSDKAMNIKTVLDEESNNLVSIIGLGLVVCVTLVVVNGDFSLNPNYRETSLFKILQNIMIVFSVHLVGGFGSFTKNEKFISILNGSSTQIFSYVKLTVIPYFVFTNLKPVINFELQINNTSFLIVLMVFLIICYTKEFVEKRFESTSYSLAVHNMLSICFIFLLTNNINAAVVFIALMLNFLLFEVLKNNYFSKFCKLRNFLNYLYVGIPISPLFIYKIYFYEEIIGTMDIGVVLAFSAFTFLPLFLFCFFNKPGMSNVKV